MIKKHVSDTEVTRLPHLRNLYQLLGSKKSHNQQNVFYVRSRMIDCGSDFQIILDPVLELKIQPQN